MDEIFILNKDKYYQLANKYIKRPLFFGYWNSINSDYGGQELIDEISKIDFKKIQDLVYRLNFKKFDFLLGPDKNKLKNILVIYGPSIYDYSFVSLRISFQFRALSQLIAFENVKKLYFSSNEILQAHSFLSNKIINLNTDIQLISNNAEITNLILFYLCYVLFKDKVEIFNDNSVDINKNDLFLSIKEIKSFNLPDLKNQILFSNFRNHKYDLSLVNTKSLFKRILKKVNFLQNSFSKYFRTDKIIFNRLSFDLNVEEIEFSLLKFLLPQVNMICFKKLFKEVLKVSFLWKSITISSLHLASVKVRLLLNNLRDIEDSKCKIKLYNEHGSSFFKSFSHVLSASEEDIFNAVTIYRKNYPRKKNLKYEFGITTQKIPFWVSIFRYFNLSKKFPIFIGAQIYKDLKNNNYRYLLHTNYLNNSYASLFKLMSKKNSYVGFIPSKNVRRGYLNDSIYKIAMDSKFQIFKNYNSVLINASCLILTYPETTMVEAIFLNIPFLLYCDIDNYPLHPNSKIWYEKLYKYGVAYKLNEFEKLYKMIISGKIYELWKNEKFKVFLKQFKDFVL